MWLLPLVGPFARAAIRTFYRFEISGPDLPRSGPLLLVANHPNMGADAGAVVTAAGRPARFLAKAPLFSGVGGPLLRGIGAIPVYRRQDDPAMTERNDETFRAAREALAAGAAIAIFPEGISHGEPSLAPLRTGAARIALSAAEASGKSIPIVAVGLTYRDKTRFRSHALASIGSPVAWDDLAARGENDPEAVRELTGRIERALRDVTVNLETWDDAPAVEAAEGIYAAELGLPRSPEARAARRREIAGLLARLRAENSPRLAPLERSLVAFDSILRRIGLRPATLEMATRTSVAFRWILGRSLLFALGAPILAAGVLLFVVPYRLTGWLSSRARGVEVQATIKILGGAAIFLTWIALLSLAAGLAWGTGAGIAALGLLPLLGLATVELWRRWERARFEARTFLLLQSRSTLHQQLLAKRRQLGLELEELRRELARGTPGMI